MSHPMTTVVQPDKRGHRLVNFLGLIWGETKVDQKRSFNWVELAIIGAVSGVAVSLGKLMQAGFYLGDAPDLEFRAALLTYFTYMAMGAIGAVFLVDHEDKGQKMFKRAFLMGFVAPSFFLAVLNQPITSTGDLKDAIRRVPRISELFVSSAHAQQTDQLRPIKEAGLTVSVIEKKNLDQSFGAAMWRAFGRPVSYNNYAYVVGATGDPEKALATANEVNAVLRAYKGNLSAKVFQPKGKQEYYVAVGELGSVDKVGTSADIAKEAAIAGLDGTDSEESKRAAALMLKGQVVDVRAMFAGKDSP